MGKVVAILAVLGVFWAVGAMSDEKAPADAARHSHHQAPAGQAADSGGAGSGKAAAAKHHRLKAKATESHAASAQRAAHAPRAAKTRTYLVARIVDGDTLELANGETVRLVGIDTPEVGDCGYQRASDHLSALALGKQATLAISDEDHDRYGRLLRYVDVGGVDTGLNQIRSGLAIARYDSRDGYGYHPREPRYIAADRRSPNPHCAPAPVPLAQPATSRCEPGYRPCVPVFPPDVDCADVNGPIRVTGPDPHGLDGDGDGWACE